MVCFTKRGIALQPSDQAFYVRDGKDYPIVTLEDAKQAQSYSKGYIRNEIRTVLGTDFDIGIRGYQQDISFLQATLPQISYLTIDSEGSTEKIEPKQPATTKQPEEKKASPYQSKLCEDCGKENGSCLSIFGRFFCPHCLLNRLTTLHLASVPKEKNAKDRVGQEEAEWTSNVILEAWSRVRNCLGEAAYPGPCPLLANNVICQGKDTPIGPDDPRKGHVIGKNAICAEGGCPVHVLCKACANGKTGCPVCGAAMTYKEVDEVGSDSVPPQ